MWKSNLWEEIYCDNRSPSKVRSLNICKMFKSSTQKFADAILMRMSSRIILVQMNNFKAVIELKRFDRMKNKRTWKVFSSVYKIVDKVINCSIMRWYGQIKIIIENRRKKIFKSKKIGVKTVGRLRISKKLINLLCERNSKGLKCNF